MIYGTQEFAQLLKDVTQENKRHPLYDITVKHAEAMSVHIYGDKPLYLLQRARPREEEEVKLYRIENYEPTTKAGADKAIDIVSKIFNPTLSSIRWKESTSQSEALKEYTFEYFPKYNSLVNYNKEVGLRKMLADPNAIQCVKPGPPMPQEKTLQPEVVIYGSPNVWYYDEDHYLAFIRKEEIVISSNEKRCNYYFDYYDKDRFVHFYTWYDGSTKEIYVEEIQNYETGWNEVPVWSLKGKSKSLDNGAVVYESYFSSALPHWNLVVIHESDLIGAFINHMHPLRYELVEECHYQMQFAGQAYSCHGGTIRYPGGKNGESISQACHNCSGTGKATVKSPYGTYQFSREKLSEDNGVSIDPVGFINVPVEATKLLKEHTQDMNRRAMWAINMDVEDEVGEVQSGVAKTIDRSAQHDTIFNIGAVIFDEWLQNQYYFINKYMFKEEARSTRKDENKNLPEINKPTKFDILTTGELTQNFKVAKESGLDRNFLREKQKEIISREFSSAPDVKTYLVSLVDLDPLYGMAQNEINLGVNSGVVRKVDWTIHENLKTFIDRAIEENKDFLNQTMQKKIAKLEEYANALISEEQPRIDEAMMDRFEQQNAA